MKHIAILAADSVVASTLTGIEDFFLYCNTYHQVINSDPEAKLFSVGVYSPDGKALQTPTGVSLPAQKLDPDLTVDGIIVAGGMAHDRSTVNRYYEALSAFFPFLDRYYKEDIPISSCCSGTFVLAQKGYLNGRKATTAWWMSELFRRQFPEVELVLEQLVVKDGNILTAGATTSYLSLCLAYAEILGGETLANQMAKILLVDPNRASQLPYMTLQPTTSHNDSLVRQVQNWMQHNIAKSISLDDIADKFAITKRTLIRRFKSAINDTPANYLQRMRVEEAKRLLESTSLPIERIVEKVGYEDTSSFRKLFTEIAELTPKAYRDKFNQRVVFE